MWRRVFRWLVHQWEFQDPWDMLQAGLEDTKGELQRRKLQKWKHQFFSTPEHEHPRTLTKWYSRQFGYILLLEVQKPWRAEVPFSAQKTFSAWGTIFRLRIAPQADVGTPNMLDDQMSKRQKSSEGETRLEVAGWAFGLFPRTSIEHPFFIFFRFFQTSEGKTRLRWGSCCALWFATWLQCDSCEGGRRDSSFCCVKHVTLLKTAYACLRCLFKSNLAA